MTTPPRPKDFTEHLVLARAYMEEVLRGRLLDPSDPQVRGQLSEADNAFHALMQDAAAQARADLYGVGGRIGLSEREITIALMRPLGHLIRPDLLTT